MDTNLTGTYTSIAAVAVYILSLFKINTTVDQILVIISAIGLVAGIIKQAYDHVKLGQYSRAQSRLN